MKPSEYFQRQCVVSIEPDEVVATNVINQCGSSAWFFPPIIPTAIPSIPKR